MKKFKRKYLIIIIILFSIAFLALLLNFSQNQGKQKWCIQLVFVSQMAGSAFQKELETCKRKYPTDISQLF